MSHQVVALSIHDEGGQTIVFEEGHEMESKNKVQAATKLTGFFELCCEDQFACELTYDQVPIYYWYFNNYFIAINYKFRWNQTQRKWIKRKYEKKKLFVRLYSVSPRRTELFAIR